MLSFYYSDFYLASDILGCRTFVLSLKLKIDVLYILGLISAFQPETPLRFWFIFQMTSSNVPFIHNSKLIYMSGSINKVRAV